MVAQVISRYCFSSPLTWAEELARYQMIALAYVCSVSVMLDRAHLRVTFILDKLSKTTQSMLKVPVLLLQAAFLFLIFYYSIPMLKEGLRVEAVSLGTSMFPFYLPITISFFLMFLESLIQTVEAFIKAYKLLFTGV
ncbi:TRAP transporter small permease [uncultured Desulfosarcina sp.]|uniref:TRAP transporter small permease n=1 Tax=uncultured Desulfosarcina sp. TaxID=218289 RepID=UPI0029C72A63|nr:TRAP transporter small permease [uncultured Desulfosarcina sp.]